MGTGLDDFSLLQDDDLVGIDDGGESVGNHHDGLGSLGNQRVKSCLHLVLTLSVESAGGLIEEEHAWISHETSCDRDSLLLTSRETRASLTHWLVEALREQGLVHDEVVAACLFASSNHLLLLLFIRQMIELASIEDV